MNLFGLGTGELVFLLILGFLLLGPEEMQRLARMLGRLLRRLYMSTFWRMTVRLRYEFESYLREEIRRAGLEELERLQLEWQRELQQAAPPAGPSILPPGTPLTPSPSTSASPTPSSSSPSSPPPSVSTQDDRAPTTPPSST